MKKSKKVVVIGGGPAGHTAAIYLSRAGLDTTLYTGDLIGGQLSTTTEVENYPAFITTGPVLMEAMLEHSKKMGVDVQMEAIESVDFSVRPFKLETAYSGTVYADGVVIATGSYAKYLSLPNEQELLGRGVSGCATCDGMFFKGEDVAVVGGGNTAVEEAMFLSQFAKSVTLIVRSEIRAENILVEKLKAMDNIKIIYKATVKEIVGKKNLEKVVINTEDGVKDLNVSGLFIAIGHSPNSEVFKDQLKIRSNGYIWVDEKTGVKTSVDGVFAAGDVADDKYRQAITSAGAGCKAALELIANLRD